MELIKILQFIKRTFLLDVYDLNYSKSSEIMNYHSVMKNNPQMIKRGVFTRLCSFVYHFAKNINTIQSKNTNSNFDVLIFVNSINQKSSLEFLQDKLGSSVILGVEVPNVKNYPVFWAYLISILFMPLLIWNYFRGNNYQKKSFQYGIDDYILIYGFYLYSSYFLLTRKVKILVVSNDHMGLPRTLRKAASDQNIKTIYIQHASVSSIYHFPKLEFDYAFLEGMDSLSKYNSYGFSKTQVILTGSPKFDKYKEFINKKIIAENIGIAITNTDDFEIVSKLVQKIKNNAKFNIHLRPHPGDRLFLDYQKMADKSNISFSNSKDESSFEFIKHIDVLIAGDSNILLEATLMNVVPLRYKFSENIEDNYGFVGSGLVEKIYSDTEDIMDQIVFISSNKPDTRDKAKYYVATVNTLYDGMSSVLITDLISQILSNNDIPRDKLKKIDKFNNLPNSYLLK